MVNWRSFITYLMLTTAPVLANDTEFEEIYTILSQNFPNASCHEIAIKKIRGGFSGTALYHIRTADKQYVLRIHRSTTLSSQDEREHHALIAAAKMGIAPQVVYLSADNRAILMDFIEGKTLTLEQGQLPSSCLQLAQAIHQAHQITGHLQDGEELLSKAKRCFHIVLDHGIGHPDEIRGAYELIKKYQQELSKYEYVKVNVHGDLNPRNIFLTAQAALFIDWAETYLEDPFYDLSYFSQKLDYNAEQEYLLLKAYLQRTPTGEELNRFTLQKKIHQAFWSLTNLYLANAQLKKFAQQKIEPDAPLKEWGAYQKTYADSSAELLAQYFYELSRLNYQLAR